MLQRVSLTPFDTGLSKLKCKGRGPGEVTNTEATGALSLMPAPRPLLHPQSALTAVTLLQPQWSLWRSFLQLAKNSPTSGSLHWPFPPPGTLFLVFMLPLSLHPSICWNASSSERPPTTLSKIAWLGRWNISLFMRQVRQAECLTLFPA